MAGKRTSAKQRENNRKPCEYRIFLIISHKLHLMEWIRVLSLYRNELQIRKFCLWSHKTLAQTHTLSAKRKLRTRRLKWKRLKFSQTDQVSDYSIINCSRCNERAHYFSISFLASSVYVFEGIKNKIVIGFYLCITKRNIVKDKGRYSLIRIPLIWNEPDRIHPILVC